MTIQELESYLTATYGNFIEQGSEWQKRNLTEFKQGKIDLAEHILQMINNQQPRGA